MESKISVKGLKKNFGKLQVLKGMDVEVREGEVVCLIGPSGSGKSTFLRCLNRLEDITDGTVVVDGYQISDKSIDINKVRENIGMVFQHFNLFPHLSVLENITMAPVELKKMSKDEADKKAKELLKTVGLEEKADVYPAQLSGGQKQRVAIAGVVAMEPKCIIMDEPTAMLDPNGRKEVLNTVHRLNRQKGVTVILITHYMEEVIDADYVFVMDDGHVVMQGMPRDIFSQVDTLLEYGLDVPQITRLAWELKQEGLPLPDGILSRQELVEAICQLKSKT